MGLLLRWPSEGGVGSMIGISWRYINIDDWGRQDKRRKVKRLLVLFWFGVG